MRFSIFSVLALCFLLTACDKLGIGKNAEKEAEAAAAKAAQLDNDGRAIGSACRQSGRALEDCYALNPDASKSSIFNGWKDMNDYMMQNKLDIVKPVLTPDALKAAASASTPAADDQSAAADDSREARRARRRAEREKSSSSASR